MRAPPDGDSRRLGAYLPGDEPEQLRLLRLLRLLRRARVWTPSLFSRGATLNQEVSRTGRAYRATSHGESILARRRGWPGRRTVKTDRDSLAGTKTARLGQTGIQKWHRQQPGVRTGGCQAPNVLLRDADPPRQGQHGGGPVRHGGRHQELGPHPGPRPAGRAQHGLRLCPAPADARVRGRGGATAARRPPRLRRGGAVQLRGGPGRLPALGGGGAQGRLHVPGADAARLLHRLLHLHRVQHEAGAGPVRRAHRRALLHGHVPRAHPAGLLRAHAQVPRARLLRLQHLHVLRRPGHPVRVRARRLPGAAAAHAGRGVEQAAPLLRHGAVLLRGHRHDYAAAQRDAPPEGLLAAAGRAQRGLGLHHRAGGPDRRHRLRQVRRGRALPHTPQLRPDGRAVPGGRGGHLRRHPAHLPDPGLHPGGDPLAARRAPLPPAQAPRGGGARLPRRPRPLHVPAGRVHPAAGAVHLPAGRRVLHAARPHLPAAHGLVLALAARPAPVAPPRQRRHHRRRPARLRLGHLLRAQRHRRGLQRHGPQRHRRLTAGKEGDPPAASP